MSVCVSLFLVLLVTSVFEVTVFRYCVTGFSVCVLLTQQVIVCSVTMSSWIKRGHYNHEYHHKQSQYVVKEYSRYYVKLTAVV